MNAQALIRDFEAHGAHFELRFDGIHLVRPNGTVLPPELIEAARARKAEIQEALKMSESWTPISVALALDAADHAERAAIMEADAGMPREWADTFAAISQASAPGDFTPERWQDTLDGMLRFCDEWAGRIAALGWQPSEVFSLDLVAPQARIDRRGLGLILGQWRESYRDRHRRRGHRDALRIAPALLQE